MDDQFKMGGLLIAKVKVPDEDWDKIEISGFPEIEEVLTEDGKKLDLVVCKKPNLVVNTGLNISLDRLFSLGGPPAAIDRVGVSNDSTAITATTTNLGGTAPFPSIKTFSPAASRSGQVVTAGNTWTQADIAVASAIYRKIGLLNTATDAGTGLFDAITGFVLDFTGSASYSALLQIQLTAANA